MQPKYLGQVLREPHLPRKEHTLFRGMASVQCYEGLPEELSQAPCSEMPYRAEFVIGVAKIDTLAKLAQLEVACATSYFLRNK